MTAYTIPIVAIAVGILAMNEPYSWKMFLGAALILAGVSLVGRR